MIVAAFVVGMLLTPPDVISQVLLAIPVWLLFELGLIMSKLFANKAKIVEESIADKNRFTPMTDEEMELDLDETELLESKQDRPQE